MRITINFGNSFGADGDTVRRILCDALVGYIAVRLDAETYVEKKYPYLPLKERDNKIMETIEKKYIADDIRNTIAMNDCVNVES